MPSHTVLAGVGSVPADRSVPNIAGEINVALKIQTVRLVGGAQKDFPSFYIGKKLAQASKVDLVGKKTRERCCGGVSVSRNVLAVRPTVTVSSPPATWHQIVLIGGIHHHRQHEL